MITSETSIVDLFPERLKGMEILAWEAVVAICCAAIHGVLKGVGNAAQEDQRIQAGIRESNARRKQEAIRRATERERRKNFPYLNHL